MTADCPVTSKPCGGLHCEPPVHCERVFNARPVLITAADVETAQDKLLLRWARSALTLLRDGGSHYELRLRAGSAMKSLDITGE